MKFVDGFLSSCKLHVYAYLQIFILVHLFNQTIFGNLSLLLHECVH